MNVLNWLVPFGLHNDCVLCCAVWLPVCRFHDNRGQGYETISPPSLHLQTGEPHGHRTDMWVSLAISPSTISLQTPCRGRFQAHTCTQDQETAWAGSHYEVPITNGPEKVSDIGWLKDRNPRAVSRGVLGYSKEWICLEHSATLC